MEQTAAGFPAQQSINPLLHHPIPKLVGRHGAAPCSAPKAFRAESLQCLQPNRDTKAESNRRSQVCEALAGTGIRVA